MTTSKLVPMALLSTGAILTPGIINAETPSAIVVHELLPDGDLFDLGEISNAPVTVAWDSELLELILTYDDGQTSVQLESISTIDEYGQVQFSAWRPTSAQIPVETIEGFVDETTPSGTYFEVDITYTSGAPEALRGLVDENGDFISAGDCDCANGVNLGCTTNMCNAGSECPEPPVTESICVWKAISL